MFSNFQVVEEIHEKDHVATQLTKAFQGAKTPSIDAS